MIPVAYKMTDDIERLCSGKGGIKAEERSGTRRHHRIRNEPGIGSVENELVVPFVATDRKVNRIKRRQPRDRLLEYREREAA